LGRKIFDQDTGTTKIIRRYLFDWGRFELDGYNKPKRKEVLKYVINNGLRVQVVGDGNHP